MWGTRPSRSTSCSVCPGGPMSPGSPSCSTGPRGMSGGARPTATCCPSTFCGTWGGRGSSGYGCPSGLPTSAASPLDSWRPPAGATSRRLRPRKRRRRWSRRRRRRRRRPRKGRPQRRRPVCRIRARPTTSPPRLRERPRFSPRPTTVSGIPKVCARSMCSIGPPPTRRPRPRWWRWRAPFAISSRRFLGIGSLCGFVGPSDCRGPPDSGRPGSARLWVRPSPTLTSTTSCGATGTPRWFRCPTGGALWIMWIPSRRFIRVS